MERLTERTPMGIIIKEDYGTDSLRTVYACYGGNPQPHYVNCEEGYCAMEKLAEYEDMEEDGSLICLPVSKNTPVYFIEPCNSDPNSFYIRKGKAKDCKLSDLNKTAFLNEDKAMDAVLALMTLSK